MSLQSDRNFLESEQEKRLLAPSIAFKSRKTRVREIPRVKGTCLYLFDYRSKNVHDRHPLVLLIGRAGGSPYFRYPPPATRAKGDTYLAAINLSYLAPGLRRYLIDKYGRLSYIPTGEARRLELLTDVYRIYDTRKIRGLYPVDSQMYLSIIT